MSSILMSSSPKYSPGRILCARLVLKWTAYPYIGVRGVIFNITLVMW